MRAIGPAEAAVDTAATTFGSRHRIVIERAVSELRAGRPIRVSHGADARIVCSGEAVLGQWSDVRPVFASGVRLVLSQERLTYLGARVSGAATCDLDAIVDGAVADLMLARTVAHVPALTSADCIEIAALDVMKFAQMVPAAVVGSPCRTLSHGWMVSVTVDDVRGYHHEVATDLELISRAPVPLLDDADAEFVVFRGSDGLKDQVAIVVGRPNPETAVPIRLHSACLTGDLFGSLKCDCGEQLRRAIQALAAGGGGVLLYLDQEGRGIGLSNKMHAYALQAEGFDTVDADAVLGYGPDERRYEIAAQMVSLLGLKRVSLMTNNPKKIAALKAHGVEVADRIALVGTVNPHNARYLKAKTERAGHMAEFPADGV
ncbi:MAG: GTP cyclohydrolase II RibA [Hyphomicrobiaceae bacterium]